MKNVWIAREGMHNTSKACAHGNVRPAVFHRRVSPFNFHEQEDIVRHVVIPFSTPEDFILLVGPQPMVATLVTMFTQEHGRAQFLLWDRHREEYVPRFISHV